MILLEVPLPSLLTDLTQKLFKVLIVREDVSAVIATLLPASNSGFNHAVYSLPKSYPLRGFTVNLPCTTLKSGITTSSAVVEYVSLY